MRTYTFGKFDSEFAAYTRNAIAGNSIIIDNAGSNSAKDPWSSTPLFVGKNVDGAGAKGKELIRLALDQVRAVLGHTPVLLRVYWRTWEETTYPVATTLRLYRLVNLPDWGDATYRYRDKSALAEWTNACYSPFPGADFIATHFAEVAKPARGSQPSAYSEAFDVTNELRYCLLAGQDLLFLLATPTPGSPLDNYQATWDTIGKRPFLDVLYLNPWEMFGAKASGAIDLALLLDNSLSLDAGSLYLGALERGEIGTPVKAFLKNLSGVSKALVEIYDDAPEWTPPIQTAGTGTGTFAYVDPQEAAVSQKYVVEFTSSTAWKIYATAYRDNPTSLNPGGGGAGWTGDVSTDYTAPSGGLVIPAAAWGGTHVAGDKWELFVRGNTTDVAWPADSADQVEITADVAGAPDNARWRPIRGRRTVTNASVTIDATTKTLPVTFVHVSYWEVGAKCFIGNGTNLDEGEIQSVTSTGVTVVFPSATGHVYAAGARIGTSLPLQNIAAAVFGQSTGAAGASQPNKNVIPLTGAAALGFDVGQTILIRNLDDPNVYEEGTISGVTSAQITLDAYLAADYPTGSSVMAAATGEAAFWVRPVASLTTVQEMKRFRLAVRT